MTLRVLVVSHSCVVDVNQEPFAALKHSGANVRVIAPRSLRTDVRGRIDFKPLAGFESNVIPLPIVLGGYGRLAGGQRGIHVILYRHFRTAAEQFEPQVIYAEEEPFSFAALQVARIAHQLQAPFVFHANQNIEKSLPPPFPAIRAAVFGHATGATVRNRAAAEVLRAHGYKGPIEDFPHAVEPSRYATGERMTDLETPVIGFVGRLVPEKGVEDLINAMANARARGGRGSLLIVGGGPDAAVLREFAARARVPVHFTGAVAHDEVPSLFHSMDMVAIPSHTTSGWKEQFGRIVIEANAAGVPVIVSSSGELPQTVEATGGGVVVREGDVDALSSEIMRLSDDENARRVLGEAGRQGVAERFTPGAVSARLLEFFESLVSR
ncbi:MAG: glycosyltransferase family 4 protein [Actinomycetota bacterium]|nr:glycosyltransferase family 4 protein [Actinomycetota bacterium]